MEYHKVIKFLVTGGLAATAEYSSFLVITYVLSFSVIGANIISFALGLVVSFSMNRSWVFSSKKNTRKKFAKYFSLAIINILISTVLIVMLTELFSVNPSIAKIGTMMLIAAWNYFIFSMVIFKDRG